MNPDLWAQVETLFAAALDVEPEARQGFVRATAESPELALEVLALLESHVRDGGFDLVAGGDDLDDLPLGVLENGHRLGAWGVVRLLGSGGMGIVYLARRADGQFEQEAALKILSRATAGPNAAQRMLAERQILARLSHPNIARLLDGGMSSDGLPYLVMEYVEGLPITRHCDERQLDLRARLALFISVCDAVRYAHEHLIVHRDLKPGNILVLADGSPKLLDFGIAKLLDRDSSALATTTQSEWRALTPEYASPEQLSGSHITTASDVYQLGILLHELLVGQRPAGENQARVKPSLVGGPFSRKLGGDLDDIILKALRTEPDRRYGSAGEFADDVLRYLDGRPVRARPDSFAYRASKFTRRHRLPVAGVSALFLLVLGFAVGMRRQAQRTALERDRAEAVTAFLETLFGRASPNASRGASETVREVLDRGAARVRTELASEPLVQARLLRVIGDVYSEIGIRDSSVVLMGEAVAILRRAAADRDPELARAVRRLALFLTQKGSFDSAGALLNEGEMRLRRDYQDGTPRFASALTDLGYAWQVQGKLGRADSLLSEALVIHETLPNPEASAPATLTNLGWIRVSQGDLAAAEGFFRRSLALRKQQLGDDHPQVATSLEALGSVLIRGQRYAAADSVLGIALDLRRRTTPENAADLAGLIYQRGNIRRQQGKLTEAVPMFEEALSMRIAALGDEHFVTASSRNGLAIALQDLGRVGEAEALFRRALKAQQAHFGADHINPVFIEINLARLLTRTKAHAEAKQRFAHAIPIARRSQPRERRFLDDLVTLGSLRCDSNEATDGLRVLRDAVTGLAPVGSEQVRDDHVRALNSLGACLSRNGSRDEARQVLTQSLQLTAGRPTTDSFRVVARQLLDVLNR